MVNQQVTNGGAQPRVGYASPQEALSAPREEFVYCAALHTGTGVDEPDFLAVVDVAAESETYGQIVHRTPMPTTGDRKSTRLNSSHIQKSRMPSSA